MTVEMLQEYEEYLRREEKSALTINKYLCDLKKLLNYADGREIDKELMIAYKEELLKSDAYKVSSINSFLVAANRFFEFMGWYEAKVKTYKVQKNPFARITNVCRRRSISAW